MMRRLILLLVALCVVGNLWSQHAPVAVNDYTNGVLGKWVTVNVTGNDYHPDGLLFKVSGASLSQSFTDSTITFSLNYDRYYNIPDTIVFRYSLKDENGTTGDESIGKVFVVINNDHYYNYLDYNNIKARIQAIGLQFWPGPMVTSTEDPDHEFEFPIGSGLNTIFNSSLWVGGLDELDSLKLAAERYRLHGFDYWPGPLSISGSALNIDTATVVNWQKVWKLSTDEVIYHKLHYRESDYQMLSDIETWPAHGNDALNQSDYLAPFVDVDGDGRYIPTQGDYPLIRGDQCIYFITNDLRVHTETGAAALGLEIHGMAYEFQSSSSMALNNTVFFSYKIFNRSSSSYHDTYIGLFTDFDIGDSRDDFVGCDVGRGTYFGYNGDSLDGVWVGEAGAYGLHPPAQGIVILGGPEMDSNGLDDLLFQCDEGVNGVGFGDGVIDNERFGMKKFIWFNNTSGIQGDPVNAEDYYNYLRGVWKDGTAMEYGGNGHLSSGAFGPSADFMFPGLSDPCYWGTGGEEPFGPVDWTEISAGNQPSDRRGLSVMGPFTFEPGTMERIDVAYVAAFPLEGETAVESLLSFVDEIKLLYVEDPAHFGYQWLGVEEVEAGDQIQLSIYPNPVVDCFTIRLGTISDYDHYRITDLTGRCVVEGSWEKDATKEVGISFLERGIYVFTLVGYDGLCVSSKLVKR